MNIATDRHGYIVGTLKRGGYLLMTGGGDFLGTYSSLEAVEEDMRAHARNRDCEAVVRVYNNAGEFCRLHDTDKSALGL